MRWATSSVERDAKTGSHDVASPSRISFCSFLAVPLVRAPCKHFVGICSTITTQWPMHGLIMTVEVGSYVFWRMPS